MLSRFHIWGVLLLCAVASTGCYSTMHPLVGCPGNCGCALKEHDLGQALDRFCTGQCFTAMHCGSDCGSCVEEPYDEPVMDCGAEVCPVEEICTVQCDACGPGGCLLEHCPLRRCKWRPFRNVQSGPPPVPYRPALPPKFLPVPVRPVFSTVDPYAPEPSTGTVEAHWGPQLSHPGRD